MTPTELRLRLNKLLARQELVQSSLTQAQQDLFQAESQLQAAQEAQQHLQHLAQTLQTQAHKQIAQVVSTCLSAVFEEPYELTIHFDRKRGKTEARFTLGRSGGRVSPATTSGGVRAVVGVALRIARLALCRPAPRGLLCLDEPFRGLSRHNLVKMRTLLETLARDLGFQMIVITHDPELEAGKVIEL